MNPVGAETAPLPAAFRRYMLGTATWFIGLAIQFVLFPWLVALELQESPARIGYAQMATLVPMLLLLLPSGVWADRYGALRILIRVQSFAVLPPVVLAVVLSLGLLSYGLMIGFALLMGVLSALIAPAREGLLTHVAGGEVQRAVTVATGLQFGVQVLGFLLVAVASDAGAPFILLVQATVFAVGAITWRGLDPAQFGERRAGTPDAGTVQMIGEGLRAVLGSRELAAVTVVNLAIGLLYMGVFMVGTPLLIRDHYGGDQSDIAWVSVCNTIGTIVATALLYSIGGVSRPGRALLIALLASATVLFTIGRGVAYPVFLALTLLSGACGGIAMTMGRTLMQENATDALRSRVMSIYTLSVLGGIPLGNLLMGHLAAHFGVLSGITIAAVAMAVTTLTVRTAAKFDGATPTGPSSAAP